MASWACPPRTQRKAAYFICPPRQVDFVKVLDFGLVKHRVDRDEDAALTRDNTVSGTPAFMSPEQIPGQEIDGRTDVYALGCVMYWLLTGDYPFQAKNVMETLAMHLNVPPAAPSTSAEQPVPAELDRIVLSCMDKKAASRPQNMDSRAEMLSTSEAGHPWTRELAWEWWEQRLPDLCE